jgi:hypothetical protein
MAKAGYFPFSNISSDDLRVAGKNIKWDFRLGRIKLGDKV